MCNRSTTASRLLTDCSRNYPYADHNTAENLIVRLEIAFDLACLVHSFDRDDQEIRREYHSLNH